MAVLIDTNILLRSSQRVQPRSVIAARATNILDSKNEDLVVLPQNIVEFWAVATRPLSVNGLGLTVNQTILEVNRLSLLFELLPEVPVHGEWLRLVTKYQVLGKNVHDARLVAAMIVNGIDSILTFNVPDFARYSEIKALDPALVT